MSALIAVLLASLFGSLHCAGMCGPLVAFAVGAPETSSYAQRAVLQIVYHGGRLATYALVGAICGVLGAALDLGGSLLGLQRVAAVMAGAMMIAVGVLALLRYRGVALPHLGLPAFLQRLVVVGQRTAVGLRPLPRALTIGLLTALLPCGWLYAFAIIAAGAGSAAWGAAVMAAFWAGTVPVLVSLGVGVQALTGAVGRRLPLATALILVALGLYTVGDRLLVPAGAFEPLAESLQGRDAREQLKTVEQTKPPCCQGKGE
ncbi:MAG: sulfite exporter TauE/SafE family protein [Pirellulaceae bacterium]|nr:sulfite exporter TauE/SafE family protein [Pirellulaceae bacterium]MCU0982172.1 sulfite exporter TauE/SafE family protein [Pirellulaceae bacterium]